MTYQLIYVDPPWQYGNKISNGAAVNHSKRMSMALPAFAAGWLPMSKTMRIGMFHRWLLNWMVSPYHLANGRFASSGRKAMSACTLFLSGLK